MRDFSSHLKWSGLNYSEKEWVLCSLLMLRPWVTAPLCREGDDHTIPSQCGRWLYGCRWISHPPLIVVHTLLWSWVYAEESRCSACFFCSWINSRYPPLSQPLSDQRQTRHTRNTQLSQGLCWFLYSTPAPRHKSWLSSVLMVSII